MIRLMQGDCLERMSEIEAGSIDLVFTSPPYNLSEKISGIGGFSGRSNAGFKMQNGYATCSDDMPYPDYVVWQKAVLRECWRLLGSNGAIFYNHKPRVVNGQMRNPLDLNPDLPVRQVVFWERDGGFNFSPGHYLPTCEWIVILAKPGFRLKSKGASGVGDIWRFGADRRNGHPAPFPVGLPLRALDTTDCRRVLDPFMGSGTVGEACVRRGRDFTGIELDPGYFQMARKRIHEAGLQQRMTFEEAA